MGSSSWFCFVLPFLLAVHGHNILFLQTTPSRSHHIWNRQIFDRLFENGHNLTILTFERERSVPGKSFLYVDNFYGKIVTRLAEESGASEMGPRAWNTFYWMLDYYHRQYRFIPNEDQRLRKLFGSNASGVAELEKRTDIVLVNSDFSMDYYQVHPSNVIPVGGMHIARSEVIPEDIARFMDRPAEGVILLSLGTNVNSEDLEEGVNQAIFNVFSSLPDFSFIWKHGDPDSLGAIPKNVLVRKWIPQVALLADPRTKLLIGHGGLLGLQEASWFGVPMVGIPFFADQYQNVDKLVREGVGIRMMPSEIREDSLRKAVVTVVTNGSYHQRAAARSKQFRNQPQPPLDRALFWIEQVLEHKGLPHLRSPPTPLYQQYGLAVAVAPFVILALLTHLMLSLACTNKRC